MLSTLELLRAEQEAQEAEEARPPFETVDSIRAFITAEAPAPTTNITLDMCWLGAKEFDRFWRAELLDHEDEQVFSQVVEKITGIDPARRNKCVFTLTLWKSRDEALNVINFRAGFSYRFAKVHSLKLSYGNPVGSLQIRGRLCAVPLPPPGFQVGDYNPQLAPQVHPAVLSARRASAAVRTPTETCEATTANASRNLSPQRSDTTAEITTPKASGKAAAPTKTPPKRKARQIDGKNNNNNKDNGNGNGNEQTLEAPTKKTRSASAKELFETLTTTRGANGL
ncbi:hypothetical protein KRP22_004765 [Phytophthora ramorum]|nr:hypothetical protein KRP22_10396 [Phytophthora ramorum]